MERGIYFDGWSRHEYCYHPSLPMRSMQMLDELEKCHGTILCWAGLGGGSISLPFLRREAFGEVDPRMQIYGFMNDSEFIAECSRRGIRLFGIVFEVQGWEFPVVTDGEGRIVRMNRRAEEEWKGEWYGLREFSRDALPNAFPTRLKDYYPDGIRDEDGNIVDDLWEACCCRDLNGEPIHAEWVEIRGHRETCRQMCRNNPVWREYLKKIMELQIDAGVPGIQLDECELPMTSISSGGCFCKSCMAQFTAHLKARRAAGTLGAQWDGIDTDTFHYGDWLKAHRCAYPRKDPFFRDYWEFQVKQVRRYFGELADHARAYALQKYGRRLLISGNFYNMQPAYYPIEDKVDIVITEMDRTLLRQSYYYRFCAGFAPGKPVIVAENPYGGIIPQLLEKLDRGQGYDLYRLLLLEASVYGCNMSVPFGGWMGNTIRDAFTAPRDVTCAIQDFLFAHGDCYPRTAGGGAVVVYSFADNRWRDSDKGSGANGMQHTASSIMDAAASEWLDPDQKPVPFWDTVRALSRANAQYNVVMLPDGDLRADDFSAGRLQSVPLVILPDCSTLTENQRAILLDYARGGGRVLVSGALAEGTDLREQMAKTGNAVFVPLEGNRERDVPRFMAAFERLYAPIAPVVCRAEDVGVQRCDADGKTFVHLLNYRWSEEEDRVLPIDELRFTLRSVPAGEPRILVPEGMPVPACSLVREGDLVHVTLRNAGVYTVAAFGG